MNDGAEVRRAKARDAAALTRITFAAKRYWGYPELWISHWTGILTITPEFVENNVVYAAFAEGEPFAFYALTGTGDSLELDHLWVSPGRIGSGTGRLLFEHAMDEAASRGAHRVKVEADPNAEGFYLRMGARRIGENVYELEGQSRVLPLLELDLKTRR